MTNIVRTKLYLHLSLAFMLTAFLTSCYADTTIALTSPLEYQVTQRDTLSEGNLSVRGTTTIESNEWQYRLLSAPGLEEWTDLPSIPKEGVIDFSIRAPAGGWYVLELRAMNGNQTIETVRVEHIGVGEVFIIAGQSNAANYGAKKQRTKTERVSSFNGARWNIAHDPQQGAAGESGSFIPAFGDAMYERFNVPIGVACIAEGGTSVREWLPKGERMNNQPTTGLNVVQVADGEWESTGALFSRLEDRLNHFGPDGFRAILWHQGESDAGQARAGYPEDRQITGAQYVAFMKTLVQAAHDVNNEPATWFTAKTTYHRKDRASDAEFRDAMQRLWDEQVTLEGPDTDSLGPSYREGVHFNTEGLTAHGNLWADKVGDWLDNR